MFRLILAALVAAILPLSSALAQTPPTEWYPFRANPSYPGFDPNHTTIGLNHFEGEAKDDLFNTMQQMSGVLASDGPNYLAKIPLSVSGRIKSDPTVGCTTPPCAAPEQTNPTAPQEKEVEVHYPRAFGDIADNMTTNVGYGTLIATGAVGPVPLLFTSMYLVDPGIAAGVKAGLDAADIAKQAQAAQAIEFRQMIDDLPEDLRAQALRIHRGCIKKYRAAGDNPSLAQHKCFSDHVSVSVGAPIVGSADPNMAQRADQDPDHLSQPSMVIAAATSGDPNIPNEITVADYIFNRQIQGDIINCTTAGGCGQLDAKRAWQQWIGDEVWTLDSQGPLIAGSSNQRFVIARKRIDPFITTARILWEMRFERYRRLVFLMRTICGHFNSLSSVTPSSYAMFAGDPQDPQVVDFWKHRVPPATIVDLSIVGHQFTEVEAVALYMLFVKDQDLQAGGGGMQLNCGLLEVPAVFGAPCTSLPTTQWTCVHPQQFTGFEWIADPQSPLGYDPQQPGWQQALRTPDFVRVWWRFAEFLSAGQFGMTMMKFEQYLYTRYGGMAGVSADPIAQRGQAMLLEIAGAPDIPTAYNDMLLVFEEFMTHVFNMAKRYQESGGSGFTSLFQRVTSGGGGVD